VTHHTARKALMWCMTALVVAFVIAAFVWGAF
jgi:beta-lactamase regulating signal transducer with metallopeptidase domain